MSSIGSSRSGLHQPGLASNISIVFPVAHLSGSLCYWKIKTNFYIEQSGYDQIGPQDAICLVMAAVTLNYTQNTTASKQKL